MLKPVLFFCSVLFAFCVFAQERSRRKPLLVPDSVIIEWKDGVAAELPVASLDDNQRSADYIPSPLTANRDVLGSMASFHFGVVRFRARGYHPENDAVMINGMMMNSPSDQRPPWAYWSGLNDVTRNVQLTTGAASSELDFGAIGTNSAIDMRAFRQRVQTQIGYSFSNRSYHSRISFLHTRPLSHKGYAFSFGGSVRYAEEGYIPGTGLSSGSYYFGVDKRFTADKIISFVIFGSIQENERMAAITKECAMLAGNDFYNPNWGYQSGKKRNANTSASRIPVAIVTYERRTGNHRWLLLSAGLMIGEKTSTSLDWYNASDPRPDYYRYLPAFQKDSVLGAQVADCYREDPSLLQINWDRLYGVNRNSYETIRNADGIPGNSISGLRSHYVLQQRITGVRRFGLNAVWNSLPVKDVFFTKGIAVQYEQNHFYKKLHDLLGGEYYINWNQFGASNDAALQNDLDHPDRVVRKGDRYGYDYAVTATLLQGWAQVNCTKRKWDFFGALRIGYRNFQREGFVRTGLFPENSFGKSTLYEFSENAVKAGFSYKINGRRFLYLHAAWRSEAPQFDDVFISPETRDTEQENIRQQQTISMEAGYILNAPRLKMRAAIYAAKFMNEMRVFSFYHDGYRSFVNYCLAGISRLHTGIELALEWTINPALNLQAVAAMGRYVYDSRPDVVVSIDNDDYITERSLAYLLNYYVGGTPQEAYGVAMNYRSIGNFYLNVTAGLFLKQWLELNPFRRTDAALTGVMPGSDLWKKVITQEMLPVQYTIDLSMGYSFRVRLQEQKPRTNLLLYLGVGNLTNNKKMLAGGYEQLRFDAANANYFAPKFFHAPGLNYSLNIGLRL